MKIKHFWESLRLNQWKNWKFLVKQPVFLRVDMLLGMIGDQKHWNSEAHKKYLSLDMKQPLVTFGPLWVLYKRLFWAHFNSYCYDHLCIKKCKISTFGQVWNTTNKKIENFWSNNQFFWRLIPFSARLRTNHYEILNCNIEIYHPACSKLWWSLVIQWFGVKTVWVTK